MAKKQKAQTKKLAAPSRRRVAPPRDRAQPPSAALDLHRCMLFLEHEARLLDEAKFDDWLALFTGSAWHRLVQLDGAIRIAWKRVDLVNCDAPLDGITQPF